MSEETLAGVLSIFENRSGGGVDFSKKEPKPEWSQSQFFKMRLVCLLSLQIFFTKHVIT